MKDSGLIISVNKDEKAAVFEVSDAGAAADLNKILDQLTEKLS
jgi:electron transfer flavoprotein alpha subunit